MYNFNNSPEAELIRKQERQQVEVNNKKNLAKALELAEKQSDEERIKLSDFADLYSQNMIKEHDDYVKRKLERIERSDTAEQKETLKYSSAFEAIIHDQIANNGWLGKGVSARRASLYDDFENGVDEIAEFEPTESSPGVNYLALNIDITFKNDITSKMEDIRKRIDKGDLGLIKYLLTDHYRGEMRNIPRVIVGTDMKNLNGLIGLWVNNEKNTLAQHRAKFMILSQIMIQLNDFADYAEKAGQMVIANGYNKVLRIVEDIWDEEIKSQGGQELNFDFMDDRVYSSIRDYCDDLNK